MLGTMLSTFQILFYPFWHSCVGCNLSPIFWIKKLRPKRIKWSWQKNLGTQEKQQLGFSYLDGSPKTLLISIWWNAGVPGAAAGEIETSRDITFPTKVHWVRALVFPVVMYGYESWTTKKANVEELMLLNCGVGEDAWASLGLQGDPTSPFWRRSVLSVHWMD